jgi:hypothetical protein|tara:strand:+ start:274 stop:804 length:531 start_codon:yes stop_codon:yes gene_type:complete
MKKYDVVFCSICGEKYSFSKNCCERPNLDSISLQDSNEKEEINFIKKIVKYCVWCGSNVKWGEYTFVKKCKKCERNVRGGKYFRPHESLSFCENCGNKVSCRDENCICGFLPLLTDNSLIDIGESFVDSFEKSFCKDCGKDTNEISDMEIDVVNEKTGEVITEFPHFCNLKSTYYP